MSNPNLLALRDIPAETLVEAYGSTTSDLFDVASSLEAPHLVVLPACNEERDLPATLLSLSRSRKPVVPIVVENGSSPEDKTLEYAERMGAIAVHCEPAKMRATQVGLRIARELFPEQPVVHFGDADNLYPQFTVSAIARAAHRASKRNDGNGALVFGMGAYTHGASATVDLMRSGRLVRKAASRKLKGQVPMPYGFNYALHVGSDDQISKALYELDPLLFVREESEICRAVTSAGGTISQLVSPSAYVFTRGDLISTREEWRDFKGASMETKTDYYKRNYPSLKFTPNADGRKKSH